MNLSITVAAGILALTASLHANGFYQASGPEVLPPMTHKGEEVCTDYTQKVKFWSLPEIEKVRIEHYKEWEFDVATAKMTFVMEGDFEIPPIQWFFAIDGQAFLTAGGHQISKKTREISILVPIDQVKKVSESIKKHYKLDPKKIENLIGAARKK